MPSPRTHRVPGATYRVQFNRDFTFQKATRWVDYWHRLGITDLYASPFLAARPGSLHGYDVVDHRIVNPEIGTEDDLERLHRALEARDMGLIMDLVPNHMCVNTNDNVWWNDVLENGPSSPFAKFFDIDWRPPKQELRDKVLLPILSDQYGKVLENGELRLSEAAGALTVSYGERRLPVGPSTYPLVLDGTIRRLHERGDEDAVTQMESVITAARRLPGRSETEPEKVRERQREKEIVKRRLRELLQASAAARAALDDELRAVNGTQGEPRTFDLLEQLLGGQAYRLSFWRVAAEHINYRRFFEINDLAAVRVEEPEVFQAVHAKAFELMNRGWVTGFRVDHIDGLLKPKRYLEEIRESAGAPYVVVEKILSEGETLPSGWQTDGTTGYEFANVLDGLFVSQAGEKALRSLYDGFRTVQGGFTDIVYESKRAILEGAMSSELSVLARRLDRISEQHRWSRDFTIGTLQQVLAATIACFPVYRTYVAVEDADISAADAAHIRTALATAKLRSAQISASAFDFLGEVLLGRDPDGLGDRDRAERRNFVLRFQELTGPVTAKGVEDTAFFRYFPLLSRNEVGAGPARFGYSVEDFHRQMQARAREWAGALSATTTHDTKRAEDGRARLGLLSEIPEEWIAAVNEWRTLAEPLKTRDSGVAAPDADDEYYVYQTIVGAWPETGIEGRDFSAFAPRVQAAVEKAIREAKRKTSWIHPNPAYEDALRVFVARVLDPNGPLAPKIAAFVSRILIPGMLTSLAELAIKATAPGVADFFQGTELWDTRMVDPDNRQPVDFEKRWKWLKTLGDDSRSRPAKAIVEALGAPGDGRVKLFTTKALLAYRLANRELFARGAYAPLETFGRRRDNVVAFGRRLDHRVSVTIAGRFFTQLVAGGGVAPEAWKDTTVRLPPEWSAGEFEDALTGKRVQPVSGDLRLIDLLQELPYAVLVGFVL